VQVHYIDVGQGDSILIVSPEGKVMLIDGGVGGSPALEYLSIKGIDHIDLMVATHPHADHIGGLIDVLDALKVSEVVTNGQPTTTKTYENFLDGIAKAKAVYREMKRGDTLTLGSLTFDVLSPEGPGGDDLNEGSLVLRLAYGKVAFLFTGDAGYAAEAGMLAADEDVQAQILKVGHHGSSSASSPDFLAAVHPEVAVYSCGVGNSYGHPHAETIAALGQAGALIYGTDVNGTVVVTSDGSTYQTKVERGDARGPPSATTLQTSTSLSGALAIDVVSLTTPASPGSTAKLTIKSAPGADCTITVYYKSGPSEAAGLGPQTAGSDGTATWQWKVGDRTASGAWRIVVTAGAGGQEESAEIPFEVR
jgi:competence protein ComEC